jgi:hypothetical protein
MRSREFDRSPSAHSCPPNATYTVSGSWLKLQQRLSDVLYEMH